MTNQSCRECGHFGPADEYHPFAFCVLIKAGQDPHRVVSEAVPFLGDHGTWKKIRDVIHRHDPRRREVGRA
jgi:hypothetical protein